MAYQKPQVIAQCEAKKSYVAGCPLNTLAVNDCHPANAQCLNGLLK